MPCLFLFGSIMLAGGIGGFIYFLMQYLHHKKRADLISGLELVNIQELREGLGKVRGRIVAQERLLQSPLTEAPCVYYRFVVEELRGGKNKHWVTVVNEARCIDITVRDQTGEVDLDLDLAEVVMEADASLKSGTFSFNDPPPRIEHLLNDYYRVSTHGRIFNKTMRYSETVLFDDDLITVVGAVRVPTSGNIYFTRGEFPFMVSDKSSKQLAAHFRTKATWHLVGLIFVAIVVLIGLGFLVTFGVLALSN